MEQLKKLEIELGSSKHKSHFQKLAEQTSQFSASTNTMFEMISQINQNLYKIVEGVAEKAIEKDPLEFIKKESFIVPSERFQSFHEVNILN